METQFSALTIERDGPVAIIINNDAPWNRMTLSFIDELEEVIPMLGNDQSVRAIVIRGSGNKHFSVGMNLYRLSFYEHQLVILEK